MADPAPWRNVEVPHLDGECHKEDVGDLFFNDDDNDDTFTKGEREHEARRVCAYCPVLVACALHGLEHEEYGVWGALSEADRKALGGKHPGLFGPAQRPSRVYHRLRKAGVRDDAAWEIATRWKDRRRRLEQEREDEEREAA